jgi:hypothetical protein
MRLSFAMLMCALTVSCWAVAPTGLDGFVESQIRAQCHFQFACCTPVERFTSFRDEGTCIEESLEEGSTSNLLADRAKAVVAAGKGTFNQARADECLKAGLDALNACDAQTVIGGVAPDAKCDGERARGFVEGNVEDGDDCDDDIECADFGFCDRVTDAEENTVTTAGKCVAAKAEGETCVDDGEFFACFPGTACTPNDDGSESTCEEPELLDDGDDCVDDSQCESGFCVQDETGTCATSELPCDEDSDCDEENFEFCDIVFTGECGDNDLEVEICDGL